MVPRLMRSLSKITLEFLLRGVILMIRYLPKVAWTAVKVTALSAVTIASGIPPKIEEIADEWIAEYANQGESSEYHSWLYVGVVAVATVTIFLGWIMLSFLTVFLVRLLF